MSETLVSNTLGAGRMGKTKPRAFVSFLLLIAIVTSFLAIPNASSQSAAVTTTTTIKLPPAGQCSEISFAFSAQAGKELTGTFGSDASISFYVLTPADFDAIRNPTCSLPASSRPIYIHENVVGHDNQYRTLPFPANGTYYFVFVLTNIGPTQLASGSATVHFSFPASTILSATVASSTKSSSSSIVTTAQSTTTSATFSSTAASTGLSFGTFGLIGVIVAVGLIASVMVFMRRGKSQTGQKVVLKQETVKKEVKPELSKPSKPAAEAASPQETALSTGYSDLDALLVGGLPEGYAVLLLSPPCDERDLLLGKLISSAISSQIPTFYVSNDPNRVQDMVGKYWKDFYALSPQADKVLSPPANLYKISNFDNLSDFNISLTKTMEGRVKQKATNRLMIIDLLTDILLQHKALTSRRWLSDFIAKRKGEGFTVLAFLNPLVSPKEETQTLIDVFDGVIEIYERELRERARRFLVVKRMYGRKYSESELMLDKDKLF